MTRSAPLVSTGQGDYRRDFDADAFKPSFFWLFIVGLALGVCAALLYDSIGGARIDEPRTTSTARSSALGS